MFASIRLEWYLARLGAAPLSLFCTSTFSSAPVSLMANISSLAERPWRFFILYWECTSVTFRLSFSNMIRSNSSTRSISSNTFVQKSSSSNRKFFRRFTYVIGLHFSKTSRETLEDKVKRLIQRDVKDGNF